MRVFGPRVGGIHRRRAKAHTRFLDAAAAVGIGRLRALGGTVRVVGQRHVHVAGNRIDRAPFRAIHRRGADEIGCVACVDDDAGQIVRGQAQRFGERLVAGLRHGVGGERQPFAAAVGIETRDVERAVVEILAADRQTVHTRCRRLIRVRGAPERVRDVFVDVLVTRVVAGIEHDRLALGEFAHPAAFMPKPPHGRAFHRAGRVGVRVDFDDITVGARLVAIIVGRGRAAGCGVEPGELAVHFGCVPGSRLPGIAATTTQDADPVVVGFATAVLDENRRPVLFTGEVGTPGRVTVRAVVIGAARGHAGGRVGGDNEVAAGHRPGQIHRRIGGDAAIVGGVVSHTPAAVLILRHAHDGHAVGIDLGSHFVGRTRAAVGIGRATVRRPECALVDVFVVHREQEIARRGFLAQREVVHAVMVHAHGVGLDFGREHQALVERRGRCVDRRAPGNEYLRRIARGHDHGILLGTGDRLESQHHRRGHIAIVVVAIAVAAAAGQAETAQHGRGRDTQSAAQHAASRDAPLQHGGERFVLAVVEQTMVFDFLAHGPPSVVSLENPRAHFAARFGPTAR